MFRFKECDSKQTRQIELMRTIPLTVLVYDGPIGRAYLSRLNLAGIRPSHIILMIQDKSPATGKKLPRFLPRPIRKNMCKAIQEMELNYWSKQIRSKYKDLADECVNGMLKVSPYSAEVWEDICKKNNYKEMADKYDEVLCSKLASEEVLEAVKTKAEDTILFTGGGIIPKHFFELGKRFIHIHPGYLPDVRGGDGLLWSVLTRGRPGASCFYMDPGIDTGDLIRRVEFETLEIDLQGMDRPSDKILYRALFACCDPIIRAELLAIQFDDAGADLSSFKATPQDVSKGLTYHFMHSDLTAEVLKRIFL